MDFARKQLEKYGWSDGKGLGKHENGISQALKPKLKRSMTGIGHDAAADFTEHWWSALYDKAASNIKVKEKDGDTNNIIAKDDTGFEITNSTWKLKKKFKSSVPKSEEQYKDFFVKTVVLDSGGSRLQRVKESDSEEDDVKEDVTKLTDEELFAACGGRTAHKGARHGVKALGKLARIEKQEQLLLRQEKFIGYSHAKKFTKIRPSEQEVFQDISLNSDDVPKVEKKKKKKRHCLKEEKDEELKEDIQINCNDTFTSKKKKKEQIKYASNENGEPINNSNMDVSVDPGKLKKRSDNDTIVRNEDKNSKSIKKSRVEGDIVVENSNEVNEKLHKTSKNKNVLSSEDSVIHNEVLSNEVTHKKSKKKKLIII